MSLCFAALMCHAPIVVPAVGGAEAARCARTTRAMREVAARAVRSRPDRLIVVSPHTPRHREQVSLRAGPVVGDLGRFRAPQVRADLPDDPAVAALGLPRGAPEPLDHGAMVPLAFLVEAGWAGPTAVLALPWREGDEDRVGPLLAGLPGRTALIASGDMSHRLKQGAPSGFHPDGQRFDDAFVAALRRRDWDGARRPPHREDAAEDVVASVRLALAAVGEPLHPEVLCYEGPWGVGYTEAILYDPDPPTWAVARAAVRARVLGEPHERVTGGPPAGVFVTLHKRGELRGCIGHITPTRGSLLEEVGAVAPLSATQDPRFPPVQADELDELDIEVSVLEPPMPCRWEDLDPKVWGVIVTAGGRRGLLLPDLEGIDTVEQQVAIARRKAGIGAREEVELQRFRVRKEGGP